MGHHTEYLLWIIFVHSFAKDLHELKMWFLNHDCHSKWIQCTLEWACVQNLNGFACVWEMGERKKKETCLQNRTTAWTSCRKNLFPLHWDRLFWKFFIGSHLQIDWRSLLSLLPFCYTGGGKTLLFKKGSEPLINLRKICLFFQTYYFLERFKGPPCQLSRPH